MVRRLFCTAIMLTIWGCNQGEVCTTTSSNANCLATATPPDQLVGNYQFLYLELKFDNGGSEKHEPPEISASYSIKSNGTFSQTITQNGSTGSISGKFLEIAEVDTDTWDITTYVEPHAENGKLELKEDTLIYSTVVREEDDPNEIGFTEFNVYLKTP